MSDEVSALANLRILDLTRVRAGPTCCRIFADFGADVIKIEAPPGLDPNEGMSGARDGSDMLNLHRNKRSITLNLKAPEGLSIFRRLVKRADIVVENFRPDVKQRLGIAYEDLKTINKRIILASISGFGETGPYRTRAGFDQIAQGMGGLMGSPETLTKGLCGPAWPWPIRLRDCMRRSEFWSHSQSASNPARANGCAPRCCRLRSL
jgi:crotonobetainyl-CoA:carnitine CoA-transferase CaiB-like acyl-CoA transferase